MRMRKSLMLVAATALPAALLLSVATAGVASAKTAKYSGAGLGAVSCSGISANIKFTPPLTLDAGGGTAKVKGSLSGCVVSGAPAGVTETITGAKITATISSSNEGCAGLGVTEISPSFDIKWKGTLTGTVGGTPYAGTAKFTESVDNDTGGDATATSGGGDTGFELPKPATDNENTTGSFPKSYVGDAPEDFVYTGDTETQVLTACQTGKGVKSLSITSGSINGI